MCVLCCICVTFIYFFTLFWLIQSYIYYIKVLEQQDQII